MDLMEVIPKRRSIRKSKPEDFSIEMLGRILEATLLATSGANKQPWRFIIVKDKNIRNSLGEAADNQTWLAEAPIIIVCCWVSIFGVPPIKCIRDTAISIEHLIDRSAAAS